MGDGPAFSGGDTAAAGPVFSERSLPPMLPRVPRPSQVQLEWMDREVGAMVTWNLQTLCGNGPGYDHNQPCQASQYIPTVEAALQWNPAQLDLDAIMVSAKSFGARYMVWVAQHMSGFSLWNSKVRLCGDSRRFF
jgi:alpha-L-fucosidase